MKAKEIRKSKQFKFRLIPVILFMAVVLIMVKAYPYSVNLGDFPNLPYGNDSELWDLFCHVKSSAILFISVFAALTMAFLLITGQMKIKRTKIYIPMAIYSLCVILSYAFSEFKEIAFQGSVNRFEGTQTILCYMFMLFYTINVIDEIKDAYIVLSSTMVGVFIACLVGTSQFFGADILISPVFQKIIAGDFELEAMFQKGQVYQTVSNMNYVGMYLALVVPLLIVSIFQGIRDRQNHKNIPHILISATLLILIIINVYGASSLGGALEIAASVAMVVILSVKRKWQKIALSALTLLAGIVILVAEYTNGVDARKQIDCFETGKDYVMISMDGGELYVKYDHESGTYNLEDSEGRPVNTFWFADEEGMYQVENPHFAGKLVVIPVENEGEHYVILDVKDEQFLFRFDNEQSVYINPFGNPVNLKRVDSVGFVGHLSAGSGRGYIISRSIPLLKNHILLGSGADTFMLQFPQDDFAGRYSSGSPLSVVFDKPHNMYLQMFICTGGVSLAAFLIMIGMFLSSVSNTETLLTSISAGLLGFLVAGIFNDSNVSIMPIFYGMLGIGIGLTFRKKQQ